MNNTKPLNSMELIQQAKEIGLLDSNSTTNCVDCKAIFPKEYKNCPQCQMEQSYQSTNFNMTVLWE